MPARRLAEIDQNQCWSLRECYRLAARGGQSELAALPESITGLRFWHGADSDEWPRRAVSRRGHRSVPYRFLTCIKPVARYEEDR